MLELYLIRHGESMNNKYNDGVVGGISKDTDLTEDGIKQAENLGKRLREEECKFDKVFASTAVRASKTYDISARVSGYTSKEVIRTDKLLEVDKGEFVGQKREDVTEFLGRPDINPWTYAPKNGESYQMAAKRTYRYLKENLDGFNYNGKVAVYAHGHLFRTLLKKIMDKSDNPTDWREINKIPIDNTSITHIQYDNGKWKVEKINDTKHLR